MFVYRLIREDFRKGLAGSSDCAIGQMMQRKVGNEYIGCFWENDYSEIQIELKNKKLVIVDSKICEMILRWERTGKLPSFHHPIIVKAFPVKR